jgi:NhaA family Na+:H+ antiporter
MRTSEVHVAKENTTGLHNRPNPDPPGAWIPFRRRVQHILAPVERFLAIEAASGITLMVAAVAALIWANSPWKAAYSSVWHIPIGFRVGAYVFERDLQFWINGNDALLVDGAQFCGYCRAQ